MVDFTVEQPGHRLQPRMRVRRDRHAVDLWRWSEVVNEHPRTDFAKSGVRN
jgi:hypothetical protein